RFIIAAEIEVVLRMEGLRFSLDIPFQQTIKSRAVELTDKKLGVGMVKGIEDMLPDCLFRIVIDHQLLPFGLYKKCALIVLVNKGTVVEALHRHYSLKGGIGSVQQRLRTETGRHHI